MKAIKRTSENLKQVADSIINEFDPVFNLLLFTEKDVTLFSQGRVSIGRAVLSLIPSNFSFRLRFEDCGLYLHIWI